MEKDAVAAVMAVQSTAVPKNNTRLKINYLHKSF